MSTSQKRPLPEPGPLSIPGPLLVPRIIHRIWFGPMLKFHQEYGERMKQVNPGWEVAEWRASDVPALGVHVDIVQKYISKGQYKHASDIVRLVVLAKFGGFYADSDSEPLLPITSALQGREMLVVRQTRNQLSNAYLACPPNHGVINYMLDTLPDRLERVKAAVEYLTGPWWWTEVFWDFYDSGVTWPLSPTEPFLPYSFFDLLGRGKEAHLAQGSMKYPPGTLFAHHYASERRKPGKRKDNWALDLAKV